MKSAKNQKKVSKVIAERKKAIRNAIMSELNVAKYESPLIQELKKICGGNGPDKERISVTFEIAHRNLFMLVEACANTGKTFDQVIEAIVDQSELLMDFADGRTELTAAE